MSHRPFISAFVSESSSFRSAAIRTIRRRIAALEDDHKLIAVGLRCYGTAMDRRGFLQTAGLVGLTAGTTYWLSGPRVRRPKGVYVQMGTSITAGLHSPGAYITPVIVGSRLNLTPVNVGFDGACAGVYDRPASSDDLSLCKLVNAITSGDWSAQERAVSLIGQGNDIALS